MSRPDDDALFEFAPDEPPDGVFQQRADTRAVPPPIDNEIDGLVDAISAGGRPRLPDESDAIEEANEWASDLAVADPSLQRAPTIVHTAAFRYIALSIGAFAFGAVIAWSLLPSFETTQPSVTARSTPAIESPRTATVTPPAPQASAPARSAPTSAATIVERRPADVVVETPVTREPSAGVAPARSTTVPSATVTTMARATAPSLPARPAAVPPLPDVAPQGGVDPAAVASLSRPAAIAPPPAAAPVAASAAISAVALDQSAVLETLQEYARAYQALDVKATAAVWPSVDRRALTRAFSTLRSHQLELENCKVAITDTSATTHCRGAVEYVRKIGSSTPRTGYQDLTFKLRKLGSDWFIDEVEASELAVARR
jgi:hypothetical protein